VAAGAKAAETVVACVTVTWQVPVPEHTPDQPLNVLLASGTAVRVSVVPVANDAVQLDPQSMPAGALVIVPVPVPVFFTDNCTAPLNVAVTEDA
jgi:hypothetical protein